MFTMWVDNVFIYFYQSDFRSISDPQHRSSQDFAIKYFNFGIQAWGKARFVGMVSFSIGSLSYFVEIMLYVNLNFFSQSFWCVRNYWLHWPVTGQKYKKCNCY